jgi:hypothetical protein
MEELTCRLNLFHKTGHWDSRMEFLYVLYDVRISWWKYGIPTYVPVVT